MIIINRTPQTHIQTKTAKAEEFADFSETARIAKFSLQIYGIF
jgi:hypothetical protein